MEGFDSKSALGGHFVADGGQEERASLWGAAKQFLRAGVGFMFDPFWRVSAGDFERDWAAVVG
jgi:hypothetical protein